MTTIEILASAMRVYPDSRIIEIIRTLEAGKMTEDERLIRVAAHDVIESRYPQITPILDARIDEEIEYTDLVVDVLTNLGIKVTS